MFKVTRNFLFRTTIKSSLNLNGQFLSVSDTQP